MKTLIWIGLGGFMGSISRFYLQVIIGRYFPSDFPWGTFIVNLTGCLLIGILYAFAEKHRIFSPEVKLFLMVGFVGSFTTYSTFALEKLQLFEAGLNLISALYLIGSVVAGLMGVYGGYYLIRSIA